MAPHPLNILLLHSASHSTVAGACVTVQTPPISYFMMTFLRVPRSMARHGRLVAALALIGVSNTLHADIYLPGTQPKQAGIDLGDRDWCEKCHSGTTNGMADPYFSWQGSMMAQAARDPVFRAALAIANQDEKGVGEFCIRCHSPRGWLAGRSTAADGSLLDREDLHGVSCNACHRMVDPLSAEAKNLVTNVPPGYGNGMYVIQTGKVARGPYAEHLGQVMGHQPVESAYQSSSELCANCHNVSNPLQAKDVSKQSPDTFGHIERTYSEWALSDLADPAQRQSCQSCHYPQVPGGGQASRYGSLHRDYFVSHSAVGGSTWVQDAVYRIWKGKDLDQEALGAAKANARKLLKTAATLGLEISGGQARLTITNLTGHKLPTGYPEGRRMWVNIRFLDQNSKLVDARGVYGEKEDILSGSRVSVPTLLDAAKTRVYECLPGISPEQAKRYKQKPGPSFHFILNDLIAKDSRIPPRGYRTSLALQSQCGAVGTEYREGQYWDELDFLVPAGTEQVEVRLMYQSVSWEYLKFLVEENHTDNWGRKLYEAWEATGKCPPEEIAFVVKSTSH
jgi:cytochrome c554/c'-like protein